VFDDGVAYGKYDGTSIVLNEERHTLISDDGILVKFNGGAKCLEAVPVIHDAVLVRVDAKE
jgi:hypothetical protein